MDFSAIIAAFLFSLPFWGKRIEKKYKLLMEEEAKRVKDLTEELTKNLKNIKDNSEGLAKYAETIKKGSWN